MRALAILPLAALATACAQPTSETEDDAVSSESAVTGGVTSYAAEARFVVTGKPTRRVRANILLASNVDSTTVQAWHDTTHDEGSFEHHTCVTNIEFPAGSAAIEVIDDATGAVLASYTKPLKLGAAFETSTHRGTTCQPHGYPSLEQTTSLAVAPDAVTYPDGSRIDQISLGFDVQIRAVRQGASWRLTGAAIDPYAYANLNHSASFHLPSGALDFTPIYAAGKRSPHTISGRVDVASCTMTDPYGVVGDVQSATYHFAFDYRRKLEPGARVFVKYVERSGFTTTQPAWSDTRLVELARSGDVWTGEVTLTGKVRPVKGYPNAVERDAVSEASSPSSLLYVFRIRHANGSDEWENGSMAQWGNYRTNGNQSGRYGHYGLLLPASCDGLNRSAMLSSEVDAYR